MVRALPVNQWGAAQFFPRLRPGVAISIVLHAALLLCLAYALSFAPRQVQPDEPRGTIILAPPPMPVTPPKHEDTKPIFKVLPVEPVKDVRVTVGTLPIPPVLDLHRPRETAVIRDEPPVMIDPQPISRGGLIYPDRAADMGKSGYVDFTFVIERDGSVGDARVVAEVPEGYGFAAAARKAFPTWKFVPKEVNGVAVASPARIRVTFELR